MVKNSEMMKGKRGVLIFDLSRGVTGEVHHVDSGYHVVGIKRPDAPDISLAKD
jgi:enoyl-[acyl-carrier protein] reductase I